MRSWKWLVVFVCVAAVIPFATAANNLGIHETGRIVFSSPVRIGGSLLPAGEYQVRHTMDGADHIMVFEALNHKVQPVKVKCQLVRLEKKADVPRTVYALNSANERVLQELVFAGDTAKHVF